jgi:RimJ/RimL family protein N-acetyltransferase
MLIESHPENSPYVFQWTKEQYIHALENPDYRMFVLMYDEFLIGYAILCGFKGAHRNIELKRIVIQTKGRGIGRSAIKRLMHYVFEICGMRRLWLDYFESNEAGAMLYTSMGFIEEGRLRKAIDINGQYLDVIVMGMLKKEFDFIKWEDQTDEFVVEMR